MRILHVGKYYAPVCGGMERVVREICEGLANRGHEVSVIVASKRGESSQESLSGVRVLRMRTRGRIFSQPLISGLADEIERLRPDVVHFHLPNPLALFLGRKTVAPFCLTIHADAGGIKGPIDRVITRRFAREAGALVFSSEQLAAGWRANFPSKPIHVIPFGFRFGFLDSSLKALQDPSLVLFVGRLVGYKGIDVLIRSMERIDGKLAIIGDGPAGNELRSLTERLGLAGKVRFLGEVQDEELADWYERCSVYVQPSVNESEAFGISMLEAMRMSRPIVSTDLPTGVQSVNQHFHTGLVVPPRDTRALTLAINTLLRDQSLAQRLGRNARDHERGFNFGAMIDAHVSLYESLVQRPRKHLDTAREKFPPL